MDICSAAKRGNYERVKELLEDGEDPNKEWWMTSLHWAASRGHIRILKLIIDYGGDINKLTRWKYTPLMKATGNGRTDCVAYLLMKGADPSMQNMEGKTAYDMAKGPKIKSLFDEHSKSPVDFYKKYKSRFEEFEVMDDSEDEDETEEATRGVVDSPVLEVEKKKGRKGKKSVGDLEKDIEKLQKKLSRQMERAPPVTPVKSTPVIKHKRGTPQPKSMFDLHTPPQKSKTRNRRFMKMVVNEFNDDDDDIEDDTPTPAAKSLFDGEEYVPPPSFPPVGGPRHPQEINHPGLSDSIFDSKPSPQQLDVSMARFADYKDNDLPQSPVFLSPTKKQKGSLSTLGDYVYFVFNPEKKSKKDKKKKKEEEEEGEGEGSDVMRTIVVYTCMMIRSTYILEKLQQKKMVRMELDNKYYKPVEMIKCWVYGVHPKFEGRTELIALTYRLALKWRLDQLRFHISTKCLREISKSSYPPKREDKKDGEEPDFDACGPHFKKEEELVKLLEVLIYSDERSGLYLECLNLIKKYISFQRIFQDEKMLNALIFPAKRNLFYPGNTYSPSKVICSLSKLYNRKTNLVPLSQHAEFMGVVILENVKEGFHDHLRALFIDHRGTSNLKILAVDPDYDPKKKLAALRKKRKKKEKKKEKKRKKREKKKKSKKKGEEEHASHEESNEEEGEGEGEEEDEEPETFEESRKVFDVHREILSLRSRYFRKKLKKMKDELFFNMKIRPKIIFVILKYIYENSINGILDGKNRHNYKYSLDDIYEVRARAKKYNLEGLEGMAMKVFRERVDKERGDDAVFEMFHEIRKLKKVVNTLRNADRKKKLVEGAGQKFLKKTKKRGDRGRGYNLDEMRKLKDSDEDQVEEENPEKSKSMFRRRSIYATLPKKFASNLRNKQKKKSLDI